METDKVIETTINKETKTPGGTTGNNLLTVNSLNFNYASLL